jgi:hypothetical protein
MVLYLLNCYIVSILLSCQSLDVIYHCYVIIFTVHRSPFTAHRSPLTAHRSPLTVHRSPFTFMRYFSMSLTIPPLKSLTIGQKPAAYRFNVNLECNDKLLFLYILF